MNELVTFSKDGDIGVITVNNPPVNALSPGVPEGKSLLVSGLSEAFLEARIEAVRNYPCGIDLLLVDDRGQIAALPRTTLVQIAGREG